VEDSVEENNVGATGAPGADETRWGRPTEGPLVLLPAESAGGTRDARPIQEADDGDEEATWSEAAAELPLPLRCAGEDDENEAWPWCRSALSGLSLRPTTCGMKCLVCWRSPFESAMSAMLPL